MRLAEYVLYGRMRLLVILQYPLLTLPVSAAFDQEEDTGSYQGGATYHGQGVGPANVVVLPIGHPVPSVTPGTEYDHRYDAADSSQGQIASGRPQKQLELVVLPGTAGVRDGQEATDQQQRQAQREEELRGDEEVWQQYVMDDVVLLLEHPPAAVESGVVQMTRILEPLEAHLPQTWKRVDRVTLARDTEASQTLVPLSHALTYHVLILEVRSGLCLVLPILTNCGLSSFPSVSNQLGVVKAITTRMNATAVHATAVLPVFVFPIAPVVPCSTRNLRIRDDGAKRNSTCCHSYVRTASCAVLSV